MPSRPAEQATRDAADASAAGCVADETTPARRVCVGRIVGVHGVRGDIVVRSFTADPADVAAYGPLTLGDGGRVLSLRLVGEKKGLLIARVAGFLDRTAAEALVAHDLWVDRAALPAVAEDEVYHVDLIGLEADLLEADGQRVRLGRVVAVHDHGAGTFVEVTLQNGAPLLVPFTREAVPDLDIRAGRLGIAPLPGLLAADTAAGEGGVR